MASKPADIEQAKAFLLWAREQRFSIAQVSVGGVIVAGIYDHAPRYESAKDAGPAQAARKSIYEEYAGELSAPTVTTPAAEASEPTIEDDDD